MRALRRDDQEDPRCRPRHVFLPALPARAACELGGQELLEEAVAVRLEELPEAAYGALADEDLGERHLARQRDQLGAPVGVLREVDLLIGHAAALEQRLRRAAEAARVGRVELDVRVSRHLYKESRKPVMPGTFKTEAIVLRSIRYGEADRILHLYSRERGRIGAVAKGVRRPK